MRRTQSIYDKLAKFSRIAEEKKANTTLSKCKYDFSKKQVRLKNHNVKLSLIDDINKQYEYLEDSSMIASYYGYERFDELEEKFYDFKMEISEEVDNMAVNSDVGYVKEYATNLTEMLAKLENTAEQLGMSPSELLPDYDEVKQRVDDAPAIYDDFLSKYKDFARLAGLGDFL
jgi:DNA repair ATPase RecN